MAIYIYEAPEGFSVHSNMGPPTADKHELRPFEIEQELQGRRVFEEDLR